MLDTPVSLSNTSTFDTVPFPVAGSCDRGVGNNNTSTTTTTSTSPASHPLTSPISQPPPPVFEAASVLDFTNLDLVPVADSVEIQNRWLKSFFASGDEIPRKHFHPHTIQFALCVLGSYPKYMLRDGGVPPFIHPLQADRRWLPMPLANCFSLVRLWETRVHGSEAIVMDTVKREMERLLSEVS